MSLNTMARYISAYAGIGSRDITMGEMITIGNVSRLLAKMNMLLYSGNAPGADQCFQKSSSGKCVVFLPWDGFEVQSFNYKTEADKYLIKGDSPEGISSIIKYHDNPAALSRGGKSLMARNYHQIHGDPPALPMVKFVVCCATPKMQEKWGEVVDGGTCQAVKIAIDNKIPVVNIRKDGWNKELKRICAEILKNH